MKDKIINKRPLRIFFSFAAVDRTYAHRVQNILSQRPDVRIFTTESLSAGEDWQSKLKHELASSDIFIVLLSPNSIASKWVLHELGAAWGTDKPIIPIVTNPEIVSNRLIPLKLKQYLDISKLIEDPNNLEGVIEQYIEQINNETLN